MSDAPAMTLEAADTVAAWLMRRWGMEDHGIVVGSIRRRCETVHDVDLLAPLPAEGQRDWLCMAITDSVAPAGVPGLFVDSKAIGRELSGLANGFKACALELRGKTGHTFKCQVFRYTPGREGNMGWQLVMRTGPEEFGKGLLTCWKAVNAMGAEQKGSVDGFLMDSYGRRIRQDTEAAVFTACRCLHLPPEQRTERTLLQMDWIGSGRGNAALDAIGIDRFEADRMYGNQRYAAAAAG